MYSRSAKGGEKGDPNRNPWLAKMGRRFSPSTPASSTTKTGRHDIVDILLKVALNTINKSINQSIKIMISQYLPEFQSNSTYLFQIT